MIASALVRLVVLVEPSPSPTDVTIDPSQGGSPGFLGFVFTFAVAVAALFLFLSLTKQMRKVERRTRQQEADDARALLEDDAAGSPTGSGGPDDEPGRVR